MTHCRSVREWKGVVRLRREPSHEISTITANLANTTMTMIQIKISNVVLIDLEYFWLRVVSGIMC